MAVAVARLLDSWDYERLLPGADMKIFGEAESSKYIGIVDLLANRQLREFFFSHKSETLIWKVFLSYPDSDFIPTIRLGVATRKPMNAKLD